jgi:signal transduction histidine kinase
MLGLDGVTGAANAVDQATLGVLTVARSVLEQLDLDVVLERVLGAAREITGARYAALGVLDDSAVELARFMTLGVDEPARRLIGPLPTGRGVLGELIRDPRPLRLAHVGHHAYSYGFPAGHPPMDSFLGVPILVAGRPYGNLYLTEKQGAPEFTSADEEAVVLLAEFAGVAIDHARRYAGSEAQRLALQRTVDALDATLHIARALGGHTDLTAILELVAKRGRALVSARALVIELCNGEELELVAGAGELPRDLLGQKVAVRDTVASAALRSGASQRLTDQLNRARFEQHGLGHLGLRAQDGLIVPLVFRDQSYGVLVALDRIGAGDFTEEDQRLLEAFAASAATAVATARSAADERRRQRLAAGDAERARWARELHDETLQALGSLRLLLSGARRSGDPEVIAAALDNGVSQLEADIANLRGLITELRPAALDQLGLAPALLALVDRVKRAGLDVDAQIDLGHEAGHTLERLAADLETGIYRIVQEALNNATKHGQASRAVVEVLEDKGTVRLMIRDDGAGFDPEAATAGFGLVGLRERVGLLGGDLVLTSAEGEGTTIAVSLPVRRLAAQDESPAGLYPVRQTA